MSRPFASLIAAAALFGLGGLFGAALSSGTDSAPAPTAQSPTRMPVEVRTVVKRRTIHVYRKPKRRQVQPAAVAPAPVAPAPVRAVVPVTPAPAPLETRTSGSSGGGREHEDGEDGHENERSDD